MTATELLAAHPDFQDKISPADRKALGIKTRQERGAVSQKSSERDLQSQIASYLRVRGIAFAQQRMDRKSNVATGWPDFVCAFWGIPLAFECKVGLNKQTEEQYQMQNKMQLNGWNYHVITRLEQVRAILTAIEASR